MLWFPWTICQMGFQYLKPEQNGTLSSQRPSCSLLKLTAWLFGLWPLNLSCSSFYLICFPVEEDQSSILGPGRPVSRCNTDDVFVTHWDRLWNWFSQGLHCDILDVHNQDKLDNTSITRWGQQDHQTQLQWKINEPRHFSCSLYLQQK